MKKKQQTSWRMAKRRAMAANGKTFTDRVNESVRTGKPIEQVGFNPLKPTVAGQVTA